MNQLTSLNLSLLLNVMLSFGEFSRWLSGIQQVLNMCKAVITIIVIVILDRQGSALTQEHEICATLDTRAL